MRCCQDSKSINDEEIDDEFMHGEEHVQGDDEKTDEFVHDDEQVNDDEDEEMTNSEIEESRNGDEEITDAAKVDAGNTEEELIGTIKDTTDAEINSLLDIKIQSEVTHIQSPSVLTVHVLVNSEPLVLKHIPETPSVAPAITLLPPSSVSTIPPILLQTITPIPTPSITTEAPTITTVLPESDALAVVHLRVMKLEKDVSELKKIDHSAEALASLKFQVPTVVKHYLGSKIGDDLQKVLQRHTANLIQKYSVKPAPKPSKIQTPKSDLEPESEKSASEIFKIKKEQVEKQKMPKYTIKSTDKAALKEYDLKSTLYQTMNENKTFNINPANHALYHALMEALIEDENSMDKGVVDTKYTTSITKTKADRYEIVGIEDMVPTLWSTTKVGSQMNKFSKHNVYSTQKILSVVSVSVKKLHGYGHLEDFAMRRAGRQKSYHQTSSRGSPAWCRGCYQKKLNITAPHKTFPEIEFKVLYTPLYKPPGAIYEDLNKQNRVMRADEMYKFSDGTL
ncbi:hypothetical protein Tco_0876391 [Tanacetum coccineum]|uniref:Uncharacterized protein n=1 Tax=Tanacetum coccineum TaxID=301880 RepID=A0ABQ5BS47_9ASTR